MARLRIVADLEKIASTDGNAYLNGPEKKMALDAFRQRRAEMDQCGQAIFDRQIKTLEENLNNDAYFEVRELYDYRCVNIDIVRAVPAAIRISDQLKKISSRSGSSNLIDTQQEKKAAIELLAYEEPRATDGYQRSLIKGADVILSSMEFADHPVLIYDLNPYWVAAKEDVHLLGFYSYLNVVFSRLSQIARAGANPLALDTHEEKNKALAYLKTIRSKLMECEQRRVDISIEHLVESRGPLQIRYPGDVIRKDACCGDSFMDAVACFVNRAPWLKGERSLFADLGNGVFISYKSPRRVKVANSARFLNTMGVEYEKIAVTWGGWEKMVSPLRAAKTPEDERRELLQIFLASRGFPAGEDCILQSETANEILGFISAAGLLKYHDYEPDRTIASHPNESHFAIRMVEKSNRRRWVLDTWETLRNHAPSIMTHEDWIGRRHTQPL